MTASALLGTPGIRPGRQTVNSVLALITGAEHAPERRWASHEVQALCEERGVCCECGVDVGPACLSIRCTRCRWEFATQPRPEVEIKHFTTLDPDEFDALVEAEWDETDIGFADTAYDP